MNSTAGVLKEIVRPRPPLVDPAAQELLDGFTRLAAACTGMPMAMLSLVEGGVQWVMSVAGGPAPEGSAASPGVALASSLCAHALAEADSVFEVADARCDPRFASDPMVCNAPRVVHYAGAALRMPDGRRVGALCVAGPEAGRLQPGQRDLLRDIAVQVVRVLVLREQERRLAQERLLTEAVDFAELAPVGIFALDAAGDVIHANPRWATLLGMPGVEAVRGTGWMAAVHPEDLPRFLQVRSSGQAKRQAYMHLYRTRPDASGSVRWIRTRVTPVDARLAPVTFVGAAVDVTPMRQLGEELEAKNRLLHSIIQHLPCGLMVLDDQLQPVLSNEAARRALADEGAVFEACDEAALLTRRLAPAAQVRVPAAQSTPTTRASAAQHVIEVRNANLPAGGVIATFTNVTEARRAALDLETSQARLQRALDASSLGLWEFDLACGRVYLAAGCARLVGLPEQDTEVTPEAMLALVPRQEALRIAAGRRRLLRGELPQLTVEVQVRRPGHTAPGWLLVAARVAERDRDGRPLRVVGTCQDISRRMQKAAELRAALQAADDANRAKSEFLATMSHEIRTPLNGVIGLARLLAAARLAPVEQQSVAMLKDCAKSLLGVVDNILDFSKIEAGHIELEEVPVSLAALVREMAGLFRHRAEEKGIRFELTVPADLPAWVLADPTRLRQVLLNLLSNALKFTSQGTVALVVDVVAAAGGRRLRMAVRDSGIGITIEQQQRLFTRFTQVDGTITRKFGGTGLGLAISRQLAQLMGGDVTVLSAPGAGSTFTLDIPLRLAPTPVRPRALEEDGDAARSEARILLVEDNEVNQHVACRLLELLGYRHIVVARDGQQAVDACMQQAFDLVLMDCQMPVLDGRAATRALRAAGLALPVIALTATATATDRQECLAAGMNDYLSKPIELSVLGEKMRRWLSGEAPGAEGAQGEPGRSAEAASACFDAHAIARQFLGDLSFFAQARSVFERTAREVLLELDGALQRGDGERARALAHRLRGSASTLGAQLLADCCRQLESDEAQPDAPASRAWLLRARAAFDGFLRESETAAESPAPARPRPRASALEEAADRGDLRVGA